MAGLARRADRSTNIWPGFVDALATLLMVVMFLLMIFVLAQFFLSEALSGREQALDKLKVQVDELADLLSLEKKTTATMRENLAQLSEQLQSSVALRDELRTSVSLLRRNAIEDGETIKKLQAETKTAFSTILSLQDKLKAADVRLSDLQAEKAQTAAELTDLQSQSVAREAEINKLQGQTDLDEAKIAQLTAQSAADQRIIEELTLKLRDAETQISILEKRSVESEKTISELTDEAEATKLSLAEAEEATAAHIRQIASLDRQIELLNALKKDMESRISEMAGKLSETGEKLLSEQEYSESARAQVALLNQQMSALRAQLAQIRTALEISEADAEAKNVQIANLGKRLNAALASKVQELSRYRSEFFGRLRDVLGSKRGVRIVGDRFVFQSEVLFAKSEAEVATAGKEQLDQLATTLLEIALEIPGEIDWILRVDGHTDSDPISTPRYPSNWELSSARAISVVKHLIDAGLPANRMVAAGFGEFHPIDEQNDEISKRRNRRIELKLTQR